jgi:2-methoxy-6-polyprenyl-1,4-benzoquinol methylase
MVSEVFKSVAGTYDRMNDLMSAGAHRVWKDSFVAQLGPVPGLSYLDVAGGTGDVAFRIHAALQTSPLALRSHRPPSVITVCDINPSMLAVGAARAKQHGMLESREPLLSFVESDAEQLVQIPSASVDAYTIAFGIRNCTHLDRVLTTAHRVLKPGGRFLCLEFSHVPHALARRLYDMYSFAVIPTMGQMVAGDRAAYQYLVESIRRFPAQEDFAQIIRRAGFSHVAYRNMAFGVVAVHSGIKPLR